MQQTHKDTSLKTVIPAEKVEKNFFAGIAILFSFYIICAFIEFVIVVKRGYINWGYCLLKGALIIIPCLGLVFYLLRKKAGWFINHFYYQLVTLVYCLSFIFSITAAEKEPLKWHDWLFLTYFVLALFLCILLSFAVVRKVFGIDRLTLKITIVTGFLVSLIFLSMAYL